MVLTSSSTVEIPFTDSDFEEIAKLARSNFGLSLADSKKPLVYSRLAKRLKARSLTNFPDYLLLLNQPQETDERLELISALTTNVTSFFREKHHFELLEDKIVPLIKERIKSSARARLWSAGCSSGPEPYSIAMTLRSALTDQEVKNTKILATDIDPKIVQKARAADYPDTEIKGIPEQHLKKYVEIDERTSRIRCKESIRNIVTFAELNLMSDWPFKGPFEAIFCRNVAIYFDQDTQQKLWMRFHDMLCPGGYLVIGHSERISGLASEKLTPVGITSYQKLGQ